MQSILDQEQRAVELYQKYFKWYGSMFLVMMSQASSLSMTPRSRSTCRSWSRLMP